MGRDGSVGVQGWAHLFSPPVTWELAVQVVWVERLCVLELGQPCWSSVDSAGHTDTVQCCTRELTFPSILLSLAWLLFNLSLLSPCVPLIFLLRAQTVLFEAGQIQ